jgi:hypothetical protein
MLAAWSEEGRREGTHSRLWSYLGQCAHLRSSQTSMTGANEETPGFRLLPYAGNNRQNRRAPPYHVTEEGTWYAQCITEATLVPPN